MNKTAAIIEALGYVQVICAASTDNELHFMANEAECEFKEIIIKIKDE